MLEAIHAIAEIMKNDKIYSKGLLQPYHFA